MPRTLTAAKALSAGSTRLVRLDATDDLDDGASFTGTPTVAEVTTSDLTLDNKIVNTATYSDSQTGRTVAIGKGIQFTAAGGTAGQSHTVRVTCSTDSSPAETLVYDLTITWV
jgi:hypothetical protein